MTTPGKEDEMQDFSDSDQQWFDRLGGKLMRATDSDALREADALNRALALERNAAEMDPDIAAANTPEEQERQWQRLQFRLKREGLLEARAPSGSGARLWQSTAALAANMRFWQATAALAASVLLGVLLVPHFGNDSIYYDEPPTMRGEFTLIKRIEAQPRAAADALATSLKASGLLVRQYQIGRTFTLDVEIPTDAGEAAVAALMQAGLSSKPGIARIEFAP